MTYFNQETKISNFYKEPPKEPEEKDDGPDEKEEETDRHDDLFNPPWAADILDTDLT